MAATSHPWLSVIVPTYNGAPFLRQTLDSIAVQHDDDIEVIAVDDGSSDSTLAILESYATRLPLTIDVQQHIGNWVASTNVGLAKARGEFISLLHQDDYWFPERLRELSAARAAAPSALLFLHAAAFVDRDGRRVGFWRCPLPPGDVVGSRVAERLLVQNFVALPASLFRRDAAIRAGGLDEQLWYTADWDLWLKLALMGNVVHLPKPLAAFRIYEESQTMKRSLHNAEFRNQLETVLNRYLGRMPTVSSSVQHAARFSIDVNATLIARAHGQPAPLATLVAGFIGLGPEGWLRYLRDSRIGERLLARLRVGLGSRG